MKCYICKNRIWFWQITGPAITQPLIPFNNQIKLSKKLMLKNSHMKCFNNLSIEKNK